MDRGCEQLWCHDNLSTTTGPQWSLPIRTGFEMSASDQAVWTSWSWLLRQKVGATYNLMGTPRQNQTDWELSKYMADFVVNLYRIGEAILGMNP